VAKIEPFKARMGWTFPWYSSDGSDFNYDFHVTLDKSVAPSPLLAQVIAHREPGLAPAHHRNIDVAV
jgi:predicted dithiol-disulfide oxidoreductase (DUF899 family)